MARDIVKTLKSCCGAVFTVLLITSCGGGGGGGDDGASAATPAMPYTEFFVAMPAQAVYPADNPFSDAKETLGELLFWDPILSGDADVACASCHHPDHAWADGRELSIGVGGEGLGPDREGVAETPRHSPSVLNMAFAGIDNRPIDPAFVSGPYFWDLRAETLEDQALEPILSRVEMRGELFSEAEIIPEVLSRLQANADYVLLFEQAFGAGDVVTANNIALALATYQRGLITPRTRFDDFLNGDETALSDREITGLNKFINAGCVDCHSGPMLSDFAIDASRPVIRGLPAVRTPSLRNVALTAPYMHNGSRPTLNSALGLYDDRDDLDLQFDDDDDAGDVAAFLRVLSTPDFARDIPLTVPSNLPVGGDID